MALVARLVLCALLAGPASRALAEEEGGAPAPSSPGIRGGGPASRPPAARAPAAGSDRGKDAPEPVLPSPETAPSAPEPYVRDPYETDPPQEGAGVADDDGAEPDAATEHAEGAGDPYPIDLDDAAPDGDAEE